MDMHPVATMPMHVNRQTNEWTDMTANRYFLWKWENAKKVSYCCHICKQPVCLTCTIRMYGQCSEHTYMSGWGALKLNAVLLLVP